MQLDETRGAIVNYENSGNRIIDSPLPTAGRPAIPPVVATVEPLKGAMVPLKGTKDPELFCVTRPNPVNTVGLLALYTYHLIRVERKEMDVARQIRKIHSDKNK